MGHEISLDEFRDRHGDGFVVKPEIINSDVRRWLEQNATCEFCVDYDSMSLIFAEEHVAVMFGFFSMEG
jgi:hypothetical protein